MIDEQAPIDYRYLDMDQKEFVPTYGEWIDRFQNGGTLRTAVSIEHGQVLYAGGSTWFTEGEAIRLCQKLSGVI